MPVRGITNPGRADVDWRRRVDDRLEALEHDTGGTFDIPGGGGLSYIHVQGAASTVWTINHGLGGYPNVTVVDTAHSEVIGDVSYPSALTVIVEFSAPFSGEAYLS